MHKILLVGMVLFLSSAFLPHLSFLPERNTSAVASNEEQNSFDIVRSELELSPLHKPSAEQCESSFTPVPTQEPVMKTDLPTEDEPNEDFKLETLPADRPQ